MTANYTVAKTNTGHFSQPSDTYSRCSFTDLKTHKARPPRPPSNKNVLSVLSNKNTIFFRLTSIIKYSFTFHWLCIKRDWPSRFSTLSVILSCSLETYSKKSFFFHFYDEGWIVDTHSPAAHISVWMTSNLKPWLTVVCVKDLSDE